MVWEKNELKLKVEVYRRNEIYKDGGFFNIIIIILILHILLKNSLVHADAGCCCLCYYYYFLIIITRTFLSIVAKHILLVQTTRATYMYAM